MMTPEGVLTVKCCIVHLQSIHVFMYINFCTVEMGVAGGTTIPVAAPPHPLLLTVVPAQTVTDEAEGERESTIPRTARPLPRRRGNNAARTMMVGLDCVYKSIQCTLRLYSAHMQNR